MAARQPLPRPHRHALTRTADLIALVRQGLLLMRAPHALRWRLETFGLYMPSLPESCPWWRVNLTALRALLVQLPGYTRWLGEMRSLRAGGVHGAWRRRAHSDAAAWEAWLALGEDEADSSHQSAVSGQLFAAADNLESTSNPASKG